MEYQIIILPTAQKDIDHLTPSLQQLVIRRMHWLVENAEQVIHHVLKGMPEDLAGLCRFRVGDYRILYWPYRKDKIIKVYRVMHRSEVYKRL